MHLMFNVWEQQRESMPCLHCNVVAGCHHLNTGEIALRMSHLNQEEKAANATAKVNKTVTSIQRKQGYQLWHRLILNLPIANRTGNIKY